MISIIFNGEEKNVQAESLNELLVEVDAQLNKAAIAINGDFVPRSDYDSTSINNGDNVELLVPMQGG